MSSQRVPGPRCQFAYAINTKSHKWLFDAQLVREYHDEYPITRSDTLQVLDNYISGVKGFMSDPDRRPRREWQSEPDASRAPTYVLSSQVFVRKTAGSRKQKPVKYPLHEWIISATKENSNYLPNPDRPKTLEPHRDTLKEIATSNPPALQRGDFVWISFFVEYIVGTRAWYPAFVPLEIIRVATLAPDVLQSIDEETPADDDGTDDDDDEGLNAGDTVFMSAYSCFFWYILLTGACR